MNAANEIAVDAFLNKELSFMQIPEIIKKTMDKHQIIAHPEMDEIIEADRWARETFRFYARS
jgi:1-deoxy-D-xylulose-5-phosphate reductoisomerase